MVRNCVFLSHHHASAGPVRRLAEDIRLRGVIPWVDKLPGGFSAGDSSVAEARRVIREDASAFLLYLTEEALTSTFIGEIEVPEALARRKREPGFPLFVASPRYGFGEIGRLTEEHYGVGLDAYHGYSLDAKAGETECDFLERVARATLDKHLAAEIPPDPQCIELQISSREMIVGTCAELLRVDMVPVLGGSLEDQEAWDRLIAGLTDVKIQLGGRYGRPRLLVNGSKHLTTAFVFGRVFNRFPLDIRQTPSEYWRADGPVRALEGFSIEYQPSSFARRTLLVELATGEKDVSAGVDVCVAAGLVVDGSRLKVRPTGGRVDVTEDISRSLAHHAYSAIDRAVNTKPTDQVHFFVAAPQACFMTLATLFQGMPDVHLYEWSGTGYRKSAIVPSGV